MRVTQSQITRQYLANSNTALSNMNKINTKILTQRKFLRTSEDNVGAAKALIIRKNLLKNEMYSANLRTADGIYKTAEESLRAISSITTSITDSIIQGANSTNSDQEKEILAKQVRNMADELLSQINNEYADRKMFGGTNNSTIPFVYDSNTKTLSFNGVDVNSQNLSDFPRTSPIYVDVGLGMKTDVNGAVDPQTVMDISLNGAKILGFGTDAEGDPNNLISLCFEAADALDNEDTPKALDLLEKINNSKSNLMMSITNLGNMQKQVERTQDRINNDILVLQTSQQSVEGVDLTEEITNYKVAEMAYNATLSMGGQLIPMTIFDFIR